MPFVTRGFGMPVFRSGKSLLAALPDEFRVAIQSI
jgi:hypothetical protein